MANKDVTGSKTVTISADAVEAMQGLIAIFEQREREQAERIAKIEASKPKPPMSFLTDQDIYDVESRIERVIHSLRSMYELAEDAMQYCSRDTPIIALTEMARANIKGLDACLEKLSGDACGVGAFATEFD